MGKIQLTPSELQTQANEMQALETEYSILFTGVSSDLKNVNGNWSANLSNNFEGKINSAQKSFTQITQELMKGSKVANTCAVTFESVDTELAKLSQGSAPKTVQIAEKPKPVDMGDYLNRVSAAEYAKLCELSYSALKSDDPQKAYIDLLYANLPEKDPLRKITSEQVIVTNGENGFSAITILDGDNALVVFAGTNGDRGDLISDAQLFLNPLIGGGSTAQSKQAIDLVNELSKTHSNIVVTGHSLGGYLATSATLKNSSVSKCVTFDAPGRYDAWWQELTNDQAEKIQNYEARGSYISSVGYDVGSTERISVESSGGDFKIGDINVDQNHDIGNLHDALNEKSPMENSWN